MSMEVQTHVADQVELKQAVLLYGSAHRGLSYATMHPISVDKGEVSIRPGKPLRDGHLRRLVQELIPTRRATLALLPAHVLACGDECIVWYRAAQPHTVWVRAAEPLGERRGIAPLPALVFAAYRNELYVHALKCRARPDAKTPLYHAPMLNVWESGQVCTGNVCLPTRHSVDAIAQWELAFWNSTFTHTNHTRVVRHEGGALALWRDLLDGRHTRFPTRVLVPSPLGRLGRLIEMFAGEHL